MTEHERDTKSDQEEFEERAPSANYPNKLRNLITRPTAKTEQRAWTVFFKSGQVQAAFGIMTLNCAAEAVGRASAFLYVDPVALIGKER